MDTFVKNYHGVRLSRLASINCPHHVHTDPEVEIIIILNGNADCTICSKKFHIKSGDIIFVSQYQPHGYYNSKDIDALVLVVKYSSIPKLLSFFSTHIIITPILENLYNKSNFKQFTECMLHDFENNSDEQIINEYMTLFVFKLINYLDSKNRFQNIKSTFLMKAQEYCKSNYGQDLTISDIAKAININPNYLSYSFSKYFGMTIMQYVNSYRISDACQKLERTNIPISEIALLCGFQSIRTFNREFKENMQISPSLYRKQTYEEYNKNK